MITRTQGADVALSGYNMSNERLLAQRMATPGSAVPFPGAEQPFDAQRAREISRDFEAVFMRQLLGAMRTTTLDGPWGNDPGQRMYRGMLDDALADKIAAAGGIGLADMIYRDLERVSKGQSLPQSTPDNLRPLPGPDTPLSRTPDGQPLRVKSLVELEQEAWHALPQP